MSPTILFVSGLVLLLATLDSGWAWQSTVTSTTILGHGSSRCGSSGRSAASPPLQGGRSDIASIGTIGWCSAKKSWWADRRRTHFPPSVTVAFASKTEDREKEVVDTAASDADNEGAKNELEVGEMYSNPLTALLGRFLSDADTAENDGSSAKESEGGLGEFIDDFDVPKAVGLSIEEMVRRLDTGLREREWFVTGNVCPELFADDFFFKDPDVQLRGIKKYAEGVRKLFDQDTSRAEIISCELDPERTESANASSSSDVVRVVSVRWRLSGRVNIGPVGLNIKPYIVTSDLHVRENDGLVVYQEDTFDIPGWDLLLSSFAPWLPFLAPPAPPVSEMMSSKTTTTEG